MALVTGGSSGIGEGIAVALAGAGDAFVAGFLPAWLDKKPPGEALAGGCRLAAHALGLIGARPVL